MEIIKRKPRFRYTEEHIKFVKNNVVNRESVLADMFCKQFGICVTVKAISSLKKRLGIKSGLARCYRKFSDAQVQFVKENVVNPEKVLTKMLNEKFGTNYDYIAISNLKSRLGIRSGLVGGRFEKGQPAHNKGKKWNEFMSPEGQINSRKTTFKKGNIPHNHKPVGSERVNVEGYVEIKVAEPNKWKLKHRLLWEEHNGKIPEGCKIIFLDRNKLNIKLENLDIVQDSEELIMCRNNLFNTDSDFTKSGLLVAKVQNKLNKLKRRKDEKIY